MRTMCRLACSVALRIASGTSRALPWPKPTRPLPSPTTTRAAKPKRRPPFTTLATRLMCTSLSIRSLSRSSLSRPRPRPRSPRSRPPPSLESRCCPSRAISFPLELEAAFAGRVCERLDAPMIDVATAVEHDLGDAGGLGALSDLLAHGGGGRHVPGLGFLAVLFVGRGRGDGHGAGIVDHLGIDVLARAEDGQARPGAVAGQAIAGARLALLEEVLGHYFFLPSLRRTYSPS